MTQELIERLRGAVRDILYRNLPQEIDADICRAIAEEFLALETSALQSQSARIAEQDALARKALRWFEDNGCAGSLQIELRNSLTKDSTSG